MYFVYFVNGQFSGQGKGWSPWHARSTDKTHRRTDTPFYSRTKYILYSDNPKVVKAEGENSRDGPLSLVGLPQHGKCRGVKIQDKLLESSHE